MKNPAKKRDREIMDQINYVLYNHWDPIGVKNLGPDDEYNFLIAKIYRMLESGASKQELIDGLFKLEKNDIGLSCKDKHSLEPVAQKLLEINIKL
jgi:hypothetical protein